jgi:hypothetical protein
MLVNAPVAVRAGLAHRIECDKYPGDEPSQPRDGNRERIDIVVIRWKMFICFLLSLLLPARMIPSPFLPLSAALQPFFSLHRDTVIRGALILESAYHIL